MKEKDVRDHINAFLRSRLQNLVVPVSLGLGVMAWGCGDGSVTSTPDARPSTVPTGGVVPIYGFPMSGGAGGSGGGSDASGSGGSGGTSDAGASGGSGGTSDAGVITGRGGVYGFPASGGSGGKSDGGVRLGAGGIYGFPPSGGGGMLGTGGTIYGTGIFRDAAPDAPARDASEAGVAEANPSEAASDGRRDQ